MQILVLALNHGQELGWVGSREQIATFKRLRKHVFTSPGCGSTLGWFPVSFAEFLTSCLRLSCASCAAGVAVAACTSIVHICCLPLVYFPWLVACTRGWHSASALERVCLPFERVCLAFGMHVCIPLHVLLSCVRLSFAVLCEGLIIWQACFAVLHSCLTRL